ncbi:MAG: virulence RhuM family protein [Firmicutes bacterium]|nr:virulence RhuM family protein [Bacillota bacterium]
MSNNNNLKKSSKNKKANQKSEVAIRNATAEFLTFSYQSSENDIEIKVQDETVWLTQKFMALLFETSVPNINMHLENIYKEQELEKGATIKDFLIVQTEGKRQVSREVAHYNLDAIIAVGYRVNTKKATDFRRWATTVLRNFIIRGYVLDKKRLENGAFFNEDYFERLLDEIREIRLSERRFYQKLIDIYATSLDYDGKAQASKDFFAKVQNKVHYAVHGQTAAEIIYKRANASKEHMGLTTWEKAPHGKIVKADVVIAKNYLDKEELEELALIVDAYLDLAESRARRRIPMTMADWSNWLDITLKNDLREVLDNAGSISKDIAQQHALSEFEKYRVIQDKNFKDDFDRFLEELEKEASKQ